MELSLAPRVNLLTGDNGLGKSFLLDVAWWALTRRWPQEVNREMTSGYPAQPRDRKAKAVLEFALTSKTRRVAYTSHYSLRDEAWTGKAGRPWNPGLVIYAHADGSFSVWDPARNYWKKKGKVDVQERLPAYVFTPAEVWSGLSTKLDGKPALVCNGLIRDWAFWIRGNDANAAAMKVALKTLSPVADPGGELRPGRLMRLSVNDPRDFPSIETEHSGPVPIVHTSSGVRRVAALAYILTWSWGENRLAAEQLGEEPASQVVMLFDEVESHLHPRWQRVVLKALRDLVGFLHEKASAQLIVATHSPLVLASAEPWFDPAQDAWFDLDLEGHPPKVELRKRGYAPRGTAGSWLTSEAFDLATDRGSVEAEQAILRARELLRQPQPSLEDVMQAHSALRAALPDVDRFWVRWNAFVERCGGEP
jgi:hypothetical protein